MASIGYVAPPDTSVSFTLPDGSSRTVTFKDGKYTASKDDEIAALDAVAELENHPVGFAPKSSKE